MSYEFPVPETAENQITYAKGNACIIPVREGGRIPFAAGRVLELHLGNPGGVMLVEVERL